MKPIFPSVILFSILLKGAGYVLRINNNSGTPGFIIIVEVAYGFSDPNSNPTQDQNLLKYVEPFNYGDLEFQCT